MDTESTDCLLVSEAGAGATRFPRHSPPPPPSGTGYFQIPPPSSSFSSLLLLPSSLHLLSFFLSFPATSSSIQPSLYPRRLVSAVSHSLYTSRLSSSSSLVFQLSCGKLITRELQYFHLQI
ncbi:uncharacterized protein BO88DRAFT_145507 [Aspergillus vadensis CBS 113365]|uniref:Uncharacterized protein n=1 Tax=Aspergillus vadensis (strain CBS 113365 / IMI 142717 / IBT 24658) TaxID=1448311 RepID=A0A319AY76_ASPVC|nr:hypothetical protein BO88DRAFT_145507 [Aspergillus vadensis CBS 113365]PYH65219.1 hypothetical protein BO88DRAFT_145507 [Aspergillus vadensis CBS 113365]